MRNSSPSSIPHCPRLRILPGLLALALAGCDGPAPGPDLAAAQQASYAGDLSDHLGSPVVSGDTTGLDNDLNPPCVGGSSNAADAFYTWFAPVTDTYVFSTAGSSFDTILSVYAPNGSMLGCNDDSNGTLQSQVTVGLTAGQLVSVAVDGYFAAEGPFQLGITRATALPANGMHLWMHSNAGVSAPDGRVSSWADLTGNGHNATMPVAARQPFWVLNALNGWPVVRFSGAQSMTLNLPATPFHFTMFVVGRNTLPGESYSMILGPAGSAPNNQLRWEGSSQLTLVGTGNAMPVETIAMGSNRDFHVLTLSYDGSVLRAYRNGALLTTLAFSTSGSWDLNSIGSFYSSDFMQGDLAEIVIYERVLSDAERAAAGNYFHAKFGL